MADAEDEAAELGRVRALAEILAQTGLSEIELEAGGVRIRVAKSLQATAVVQAAPVAAAAPTPAPSPSTELPVAREGELVSSPMVGTVYLQPQPGASPFVRLGDQVEAGQTLFLVEAMKTMNPIPAPRAGRVTEILVADGQPVEYGEALAVIV